MNHGFINDNNSEMVMESIGGGAGGRINTDH